MPKPLSAERKSASRAWISALVAAILVLALGVISFPRAPQLSTQEKGDEALLAEARKLLQLGGGDHDRVSIAVIEGDTVRSAHFGADEDTEYEIGSITKTMTASLLSEMIASGELAPNTPLGELLDIAESPAADIPLEALATHHSGLPRLPETWRTFFNSAMAVIRAGDPYGSTIAELEADARSADLGESSFLYSNFGFALLGQALAARAQIDYPALLHERILEPLDMNATFAPTSPQDLTDDAPTGYTATGRCSAPWTLGAEAPAGSVRSTLADMVKYARAQLDGSAPGAEATVMVSDAGEVGSIGYAWITTGTVTWHNGGTGGFTSWIGFDRENHRAVVVLNNTTASVDDLGFALIETGE